MLLKTSLRVEWDLIRKDKGFYHGIKMGTTVVPIFLIPYTKLDVSLVLVNRSLSIH